MHLHQYPGSYVCVCVSCPGAARRESSGEIDGLPPCRKIQRGCRGREGVLSASGVLASSPATGSRVHAGRRCVPEVQREGALRCAGAAWLCCSCEVVVLSCVLSRQRGWLAGKQLRRCTIGAVWAVICARLIDRCLVGLTRPLSCARLSRRGLCRSCVGRKRVVRWSACAFAHGASTHDPLFGAFGVSGGEAAREAARRLEAAVGALQHAYCIEGFCVFACLRSLSQSRFAFFSPSIVLIALLVLLLPCL